MAAPGGCVPPWRCLVTSTLLGRHVLVTTVSSTVSSSTLAGWGPRGVKGDLSKASVFSLREGGGSHSNACWLYDVCVVSKLCSHSPSAVVPSLRQCVSEGVARPVACWLAVSQVSRWLTRCLALKLAMSARACADMAPLSPKLVAEATADNHSKAARHGGAQEGTLNAAHFCTIAILSPSGDQPGDLSHAKMHASCPLCQHLLNTHETIPSTPTCEGDEPEQMNTENIMQTQN